MGKQGQPEAKNWFNFVNGSDTNVFRCITTLAIWSKICEREAFLVRIEGKWFPDLVGDLEKI